MPTDLELLVPTPASRELNDKLYPSVVSGCPDARRRMIEGNMALVKEKVRAYLVRFPQNTFLRDDLISNGYVGLVEAVNKMVGNKDVEAPNPTGFISQHIHYALGELMDQEATIRIPERTYLRKKDELVVAEKEYSLDSMDVYEREAQQCPMSMPDLRDELLGCCDCPADRTILELREVGHSDEDIAKALGMSKTTAYMMRRAIYARFLQRNPEMPGEE